MDFGLLPFFIWVWSFSITVNNSEFTMAKLLNRLHNGHRTRRHYNDSTFNLTNTRQFQALDTKKYNSRYWAMCIESNGCLNQKTAISRFARSTRMNDI